jgi:N-acetyl-anhydromuramyl-L-alanine amidase AmpD
VSVFRNPAPSPNKNTRPKGTIIDTIVLHADSSPKVKSSLDWIRSPQSKVSYHFLLGRLGDVYACVPTNERAWHAGVSEFMGKRNVNDFSIGVSFGNKQDGKEIFTERQYQVGAELVRELMDEYPNITLDRITTHSAISPGRKLDPDKAGPFHMDYFLSLVNK